MKILTAMVVLMALVIPGGVALAAEGASLEKGKALFNDPGLGTNGKSCNTCHPKGDNIRQAGAKKDLDRIINACITQSIKGKPLDPQSTEMQSLILYIRSLGSQQPAFKKAPVGC
jgi:cytochrome c peroxidase